MKLLNYQKKIIKKELEELRLRVATTRPQENKNFSSNGANNSSNNVDILKRISNLEKRYSVNNQIYLLIDLKLCYNRKSDISGNRYSNIEESPCSHSLR